MKTFGEEEVNKLSTTVRSIYREIIANGDEETVYEITVALEFCIKDGKTHGRGGVTFGVAGVDGPTIFQL